MDDSWRRVSLGRGMNWPFKLLFCKILLRLRSCYWNWTGMMSLIRFLQPDNSLLTPVSVSRTFYILQTSRLRSWWLFVRKLFEVLYFSHNASQSKAEQTRQERIFLGRQDVKTSLTSPKYYLAFFKWRKNCPKITFQREDDSTKSYVNVSSPERDDRSCYLTLSSVTARIKGKTI